MVTGVAVTGVGRARVGRPGVLAAAVTAVRSALSDAGLPGSDIAGLFTSGPDAAEVADVLDIELSWRAQESDRFSVGASLVQAVEAVTAGRIRNLVCVEASAAEPTRLARAEWFGPGAPVAGWASWHAPYGADGALVGVALAARAYIERYGLTRTELAQVALVASANSGGGLRLRDYLTAPMLADPLCVHDRARSVGGAAAVVLTGSDQAGSAEERASAPIAVGGVGAAYAASPLPEQDATRSAGVAARAGEELWSGTRATLADVDLLLLGDEFSFPVLSWLEALGCCDQGAAGGFVATGAAIARDGVFPVNPHGGHLGVGRRPDLDLVVEAVTQLRGDAGAAQVPGTPTVAVVGLGGLTAAGCLLLRR
ncbi:thiolase family protein [Rhodococcus sp. NPDC003322]